MDTFIALFATLLFIRNKIGKKLKQLKRALGRKIKFRGFRFTPKAEELPDEED